MGEKEGPLKLRSLSLSVTKHKNREQQVLPHLNLEKHIRVAPDLQGTYWEESNIHNGVKILFRLPSGEMKEAEISAGETVQEVKKKTAQQLGIPFSDTILLFNGKPMLDPLSLNDYPAIMQLAAQNKHAEVEVKRSEHSLVVKSEEPTSPSRTRTAIESASLSPSSASVSVPLSPSTVKPSSPKVTSVSSSFPQPQIVAPAEAGNGGGSTVSSAHSSPRDPSLLSAFSPSPRDPSHLLMSAEDPGSKHSSPRTPNNPSPRLPGQLSEATQQPSPLRRGSASSVGSYTSGLLPPPSVALPPSNPSPPHSPARRLPPLALSLPSTAAEQVSEQAVIAVQSGLGSKESTPTSHIHTSQAVPTYSQTTAPSPSAAYFTPAPQLSSSQRPLTPPSPAANAAESVVIDLAAAGTGLRAQQDQEDGTSPSSPTASQRSMGSQKGYRFCWLL